MSSVERRGPSVEPWAPRDVIRFFVTNTLGAVLVGVAWYQASSQVQVRDQFPWLDAAIAAVVVGGVANATWLLLGRLAIRRRLQLVVAAVAEIHDGEVFDRSDSRRMTWVATPAMTRYHRPGCPLVIRKGALPASVREHERAGRRPCGVCVE